MKSFKTFLSEQEQKPFKFFSPADPDTGKPAEILGQPFKVQPTIDFLKKNKGTLAGAAASIGAAALTGPLFGKIGSMFGGRRGGQQPTGFDPTSVGGRRFAAGQRVTGSMEQGTTAPKVVGVPQDRDNRIKVPRTSFTEPTGEKNA